MQVKEVIDRLNEDIAEVISHYIEISQKGNKHVACCPFHNEKTPSFTITPSRGMYKCFGCGVGGDAITFIREFKQLDFLEAVQEGAKIMNLQLDKKNDPDFNNEEYKHKESIRIVLGMASDFFREQLKLSPEANQYMASRNFITTDDDPFAIGFAPRNNELLKWAATKEIKQELLIEAGLISVNNKTNQKYDFFRNRIMFPICNKTGKVIGFTGRDLDPKAKEYKYLNTPDTPVFTKGNELFALNIARSEIKRNDRVYIVEGNPDVKRMHQIGIVNTIAPCGTALTIEQAILLKQYTNKVTLVYDGDNAGRKAIIKNAEILIKQQFHVSVIELPEGEDPDTLFANPEIFEEYNENKQEDYIIYKVTANLNKCKNPVYKSELIKDVVFLINNYDEPSKQEVYIEAVSRLVKPRKAWVDEMKSLVAENPTVEQKSIIPKDFAVDYYEHGFYADNKNCYYFKAKSGAEQRSNFIMKPLFHIESTINAKRLYEIVNNHRITRVIEIPQKDLVSISAFKVRIESLGNFLWTGSDSDLNCLKAWLYEKTQSCIEVNQMGWQKDDFFVWGNGIFNGEQFIKADKYGICSFKDKNYYLPSSSNIYEGEDNLYEFERKFINIEGNITLREYLKKFTTVFGDNGRIAFTFYLASLFRDIIVRKFDKYPMLNLFGPKGAGKNACAESLLHFFGNNTKMPNLHNTSKPALADHVATSSNALCGYDEYRNDLEMEKREFCKGLWDGTGRTRMNMDKDKKKETTSVNQAVMICGQQMATADIALFSRFMVLSFTQVEFSDDEMARYDDLMETNKRGLTHITNMLLRQRASFKKNYSDNVDKLSEKMKTMLGSQTVEARIFNNWLSILAAYSTLNELIEIPWDYSETIKIAVKYMTVQNSETKKNDDLGQFWKKVEMLAMSNQIFAEGDYKLKFTDRITQRYMENNKWITNEIEFNEGKQVLYLTTSRVFSLYKRFSQQEGEKPMPESTVEYYLKNSNAFICETKKEGFQKIDPKTGLQEVFDGKKKRTSTTALVFYYDKLPINIQTNTDSEADANEDYERMFGSTESVNDDFDLPPSTPHQKINF